MLNLVPAIGALAVAGATATAASIHSDELLATTGHKFVLDSIKGPAKAVGTNPRRAPRRLRSVDTPLFSLYLAPKRVGNAEITFGGVDSSKYKGSLIYSPLSAQADEQWVLDSNTIAVNGKTSSVLTSSRAIIFDSGTSNVLFPQVTTETIYAMISPEILPYLKEPGTYGIACSEISKLAAQIDVGFHSTSGKAFNLTIPSSELSVGPFADDPSICQTLINAYEGYDILGGSLLKHYYSVWDIQNQRMGFAPNCV